MRDFLLQFADEASAHAALNSLGYGDAGRSGWDDDRVLRVSVTVYPQTGTDATGAPIRTAMPAGGFWLVVSLPGTSDALYAVPQCMREADRDLALAGQPYVVRERFTAEQLATPWSISPQWAGVDYSNGAVPAVSGPTGAQGATGATGASA